MITRTRTLLVAAAMLAAVPGLLSAQSNVYSENVVGYVNIPLTGDGRFNAIANPLNTTSSTFSSLLARVPNGSQVLKWNHALVDFDVINRTPFGTWSGGAGANTTLNPCEGVLIRSGTPYTNSFIGEVLQGSLTNSIPSGYEMRASKVPQAGSVTALRLTATAPVNSQLLKWDSTLGTIGDWVVFNRCDFNTWCPLEPRLEVGEPFLLRTPYAFDWVRDFTVLP